jgi:phage-related protein
MSSSVSFNNHSLQDDNIITEKVFHLSVPEINQVLEAKSRRNGSLLMSNYFTQRRIRMEGVIKDTSIEALDTRIDLIKSYLVGEEKNLDIGYITGTRRYIATLSNLTVEREHYNTNWTPFSMEFACAEPFGRDTTNTEISSNGNTTSPFSEVFIIPGTIGACPVITLTLNTGDNVTAIKVENATTDEYMTITRDYSNSDILEVDCLNMTVKANTVAVDYLGVFPSFDSGSNTLRITVTGTPFNIDLDISYLSLYL